MTFQSACDFCYNEFQKDNSTIGSISDCGDYWVFYKKNDEVEYGSLPILVYKTDELPIFLAFNMMLEKADEIEKATEIKVPEEFL